MSFKIKKITIEKPEVSFPDIDSDVGVNLQTNVGRKEIIDYLVKTYGANHVAYVGNRLEYSAKSAIRDLAQVYDIPAVEKNAATKDWNDTLSVEENIKNNETIKNFFINNPELKDKVERLSGTISSLGIHAGGVILSDKEHPLNRWCGLQRSKDEGRVATVWTKKEVEQIGLIKYDILGLSSASQIHYAKQLIGLDPYIDAPEEIEVFQDIVLSGKHRNIFQFESEIGKKAFSDLMPMSIMELANASGIIRIVGSEEGRQIYATYQENVDHKQRGDLEFWEDRLGEQIFEGKNRKVVHEVLAESYGVLIYQEQLSYLVVKLSGGEKTFIDGNNVRKKLDKHGKKYGTIQAIQGNVDALKKWHREFMDIMEEYVLPYIGSDGWDCPDKNVTDFLNFNLNAENHLPTPKFGIISWMISAAAYLFSKLHAIAYSVNTYNMMWLKHHFPLEFWTASLTCEQDNLDKIKAYIAAIQAEKTKITVHSPDVNLSEQIFTFDKESRSIRYGLGAILNLGKSAAIIHQERIENGPFKDVFDFIDRVPGRTVNKRVIENLMYVGAFESFGDLPKIHDDLIAAGKTIDDLNEDEEFLALKEIKLLGMNLKYTHPAMEMAKHCPSYAELMDGQTATVAVSIIKLYEKMTKNNKPYTMFRAQCIKSGETFNVFDWANNKNTEFKEGEVVLMHIKKGQFVQLKMKKQY